MLKNLIFALCTVTAAQAVTPVVSRVVVDNVDYASARINLRTTTALADPHFYVSWGYTDGATTINVKDYENNEFSCDARSGAND